LLRAVLTTALVLLGASTAAGQNAASRWYLVPGAHYGTPSRTSFSLTAFRDGRAGIVGKGYLITAEGGRDVAKVDVGIADVSRTLGFGIQATGMRILREPMDGTPNSNYAGAETHLYIGFVNFGVGYYAPIGAPTSRKGLFALKAGVGF
jgi:hypothetical protein